MSDSKNFRTVNGQTLTLKTAAFTCFAEGPQNNTTGTTSPRSTADLHGVVTRGNFKHLITRTPCALGLYSTGPSIHSFTHHTLTRSLRAVRLVPKGCCGFRPNSRINRNTSRKVHLVTRNLGRTLRPNRSAYILLRAVTKGNARINEAFRRLTHVVRLARRGRLVNIYLSAYRIDSTKCSISTDLSKILRRFSQIVNLSELGTLRLGSSGGPMNTRGSHRRQLNLNRLNLKYFSTVIHSGHAQSLPVVLRAPGRTTKCTTRVTTLETLTSKTSARRAVTHLTRRQSR